jgi:hypothetical protein
MTEEEALDGIREALELYLQPILLSLRPERSPREITVCISDRIRRTTAREVESVLRQHGFLLISQKGSHRKWRNPETGLQLTGLEDSTVFV